MHEMYPKFLFILLKYTMWNIKTVWVGFLWQVLKFSYKYSENRPIVHRLRGPHVHEMYPMFLFILLKYTMWNIKKVWVDFWWKVLKFSYEYSENRPIVHRLRGSPCA